MRVFAPIPFRYSGIDYPYGWQDLPLTLSDALKTLGLVNSSDTSSANVSGIKTFTALANIPSGFTGICQINQSAYSLVVIGDGIGLIGYGKSNLLSNLPNPYIFGYGQAQIGQKIYISDGNRWSSNTIFSSSNNIIKQPDELTISIANPFVNVDSFSLNRVIRAGIL